MHNDYAKINMEKVAFFEKDATFRVCASTLYKRRRHLIINLNMIKYSKR